MLCARHIFVQILAISALDHAYGAELRVPSEYPTINEALDAAQYGDFVVVAPGVYSVPETRTIDMGGSTEVTTTSLVFLKDGVTVVSENGPEATILDPTGATFVGMGWVVVGGSLPSNDTVLDGFTITGAPYGSSGVRFQSSGMLTVRNCRFVNLDSGDEGGGGICSVFASLRVADSHFSHCSGKFGGAILVTYYDLFMEHCVVEDCTSETAALEVLGDAIFPGHSVMVQESQFFRNAGVSGGALSVHGTGHSMAKIVEECWFEENVSSDASGGAVGIGGIAATFKVLNNVFVRNGIQNETANGGGVALQGNQMLIANNTFWGNYQQSALGGAALFIGASSSMSLINNIFAGNAGAPAVGIRTPYFFQQQGCNVYWGNPEGNTYGFSLAATDRVIDPEFCDALNDDFTVSEESPCLPENSMGCGLIGAFGQGCGTVSIEPKSWGQIKGLYR